MGLNVLGQIFMRGLLTFVVQHKFVFNSNTVQNEKFEMIKGKRATKPTIMTMSRGEGGRRDNGR